MRRPLRERPGWEERETWREITKLLKTLRQKFHTLLRDSGSHPVVAACPLLYHDDGSPSRRLTAALGNASLQVRLTRLPQEWKLGWTIAAGSTIGEGTHVASKTDKFQKPLTDVVGQFLHVANYHRLKKEEKQGRRLQQLHYPTPARTTL